MRLSRYDALHERHFRLAYGREGLEIVRQRAVVLTSHNASGWEIVESCGRRSRCKGSHLYPFPISRTLPSERIGECPLVTIAPLSIASRATLPREHIDSTGLRSTWWSQS